MLGKTPELQKIMLATYLWCNNLTLHSSNCLEIYFSFCARNTGFRMSGLNNAFVDRDRWGNIEEWKRDEFRTV